MGQFDFLRTLRVVTPSQRGAIFLTMTEHRCSLCGKSDRDKQVTNPALRALGWTPLRLAELNMVAGPEGFICGECVALAAYAVAGSNPEWRDQLIATLTKLREAE